MEVAKMMLPEKGSDFKNKEELKTTIKQRDIVINQGILMSNWINKYLDGSPRIMSRSQSAKKIKVVPTTRGS